MTLQYEWQKEEHRRQEELELHDMPETEFSFYNLVQQGDILSVESNLKNRQYYRIAKETKLSDDPVQNFRYHAIITIALMTRFCIECGMLGEQAYRISDFYIHKIDTAISIDQVEMLHDEACRDFTQRMHDMRKITVCSKPITLCINYIYSHLYHKITVQEIANEVGLHPSYLSRLFREQVGCTLHQYIQEQKINSAKQMLQFSDLSLAEISNLLAFSSQSHFIHVFSNAVGMTPRQYRNKMFRTNFM